MNQSIWMLWTWLPHLFPLPESQKLSYTLQPNNLVSEGTPQHPEPRCLSRWYHEPLTPFMVPGCKHRPSWLWRHWKTFGTRQELINKNWESQKNSSWKSFPFKTLICFSTWCLFRHNATACESDKNETVQHERIEPEIDWAWEMPKNRTDVHPECQQLGPTDNSAFADV